MTVPVRASRDFFSSLIEESHGTRAAFLLERERWLRSVKVDGREELLFEFEMLLRGIERVFNLHNLAIDPAAPPVVTRDFRDELESVRDAVNEAIRAARQLLDPDSDQRMVFRRYIESTLADDRARRAILEDELDQDSPQESLFVLRQSFDAIRTIIDHLLRVEPCSYPLYADVGSLLLREIVLNRYFRPFRPLEFRLEYDRIKSVRILEALARLPDATRRLFTTPFLAMFRLLHYLSYVTNDLALAAKAPPPRVQVLLALIRSEAGALAAHLEQEVAPRAELRRHQAAALKIARHLVRELKRVQQALVADRGPAASAEAAVALASIVQTGIVALHRAIRPEADAALTFDELVSRPECAQRLRLDLWGLSSLCEAAARVVGTGSLQKAETALAAVRAYLTYFQEVSYQLLRYGDFEPIDRFVALMAETQRIPDGAAQRQRLADDLHQFAQAAQTNFTQVNRRAELRGLRFDAREGRALLEHFRSGGASREHTPRVSG